MQCTVQKSSTCSSYVCSSDAVLQVSAAYGSENDDISPSTSVFTKTFTLPALIVPLNTTPHSISVSWTSHDADVIAHQFQIAEVSIDLLLLYENCWSLHSTSLIFYCVTSCTITNKYFLVIFRVLISHCCGSVTTTE